VTYADAGVDISSGDRAKDRIKFLAQKTFNRNVLGGIGGFGALFRLDLQKFKSPILVSSADGVGTKLKVAFQLGMHQTVGHDLVNHCVNDIAVQGATPLFFLDYLASGKLDPEITEDVISGLAEGCKSNGCALIGGETAQMPGFYADGEYDLAGFIVGAVDREKMITGQDIKPGDVLIGFPSTGLHTNGYSLARTIVFDRLRLRVRDRVEVLGRTVGDALLEPHRSYLHVVAPLLDTGFVKGMAHITGGGITDNLPRVLPEGTTAVVRPGSWPIPPLFAWLVHEGDVPFDDAYRTFNMGIGMILVAAPEHADAMIARLRASGETGALVIGRIASATGDARTVRYER
jgi:phosphoribosylformylglycinamidine cyclo-ligase